MSELRGFRRDYPPSSPVISVDIETTAPRLWKRLPQERREEVAYISRLLSTTQEFANAGFPEGTNHGLGHIAGVISRADDLIAQLKLTDFNSVETYLLALAVLLHDSALFRGRDGHADPTRILELINSLQLPIDHSLRVLVARIAASHSGPGRLEELPESPALVSAAMHKADLRAIAAVLRLADEVAEDAFRTSPVVLEFASPRSQPFHEFSSSVLCGFELINGLGSILIQVTCEERKLSTLVGEPEKLRTLLACFLDRCLKIEKERQYCGRFLPRGIRLDSTRLRIMESLSSLPWVDLIVPSSSTTLRAVIYSAKPSLLFPSLNSQNKPSFEADLTISLRECFGDSLVSIVKVEESYWVLLEGTGFALSESMLGLIAKQLGLLHGVPVLFRVTTSRKFFADISIGMPEIIRVASRGQCLLSSDAFEAASRLTMQALRFSRETLLEQLVPAARVILEQVEAARSLLDQVTHCSRLINMIGQIIVIRGAGGALSISGLLALGTPTTLTRRLKAAGASNHLRTMFARINRDYLKLISGRLRADADPQECYLDAAYEWSSLLDIS